MAKENFVDPDKISVIIPYRDLEKLVNLAETVEVMEKRYARMEQQYTAMYGMFSEILHVCQETREFVKDT